MSKMALKQFLSFQEVLVTQLLCSVEEKKIFQRKLNNSWRAT